MEALTNQLPRRISLKVLPSLKLTFSPLNINGWKFPEISFWVLAYFQVRSVNFREGNISYLVLGEKRGRAIVFRFNFDAGT